MKKITSLLSLSAIISLLIFNSSCKKADNCPTVSGLKSTVNSPTSAVVSWDAVSSAASYTVQYRPTGASVWESLGTLNESVTLPNLDHNTTYEFQVKTLCSSSVSTFSAASTFATTGCEDGYEGVNCATETRSKYFGNYKMSGTASNTSGTFTIADLIMTVSASSTSIQTINISFMLGSDSYLLSATLANDGTFTVPSQAVNSLTYAGTGSFSGSFTMNINMTENAPGDVSTISLSGPKQ